MNFVDATLVRLADDGTRAGLFDDAGLQQLLAAAYRVERLTPEPPFSAVFDEFRLGFASAEPALVEGHWSPLSGNDRTDARFQLSGIGGRWSHADALWLGGIAARFAPPGERVLDVASAWPSAGQLDADIVADLGVLPEEPAALENARRERFVARVRAVLDQPDLFGPDALDAWLEQHGVRSLQELLADARGTLQLGAVRVVFSAPEAAPPSPRVLPVSVAILVRDTGFSLRDLLLESKELLGRLGDLGLGRPAAAELPRRRDVVVAWLLPETVFDDADWPGGTPGMNAADRRTARRAAAGRWLSREGIGVVTVPAP